MEEALDKAKADRTCLMVTHNLSALSNISHIYYMDHGSVTEQGSHADLMKREGSYCQVYQKQMSHATTREGDKWLYQKHNSIN